MIADSVWEAIKDLIPTKNSKVGRPEKCPRKTLEGIVYILTGGCHWRLLPTYYGNHKTVHGKFMKWSRMGIFAKINAQAKGLYQRRNSKNNWYAFDTTSKKAPFAKHGGKSPTDRGKRGIKHAILVDRKGAPLFVNIGPANAHDSKLFEPVISHMKKSKNLRIIAADSAFHSKKLYAFCKKKNLVLVASINPRRDKKMHKFQAPYRWIVEQTFGIISWYRGLKSCWSKTFEANLSFLQIACSLRLFKMSGILR